MPAALALLAGCTEAAASRVEIAAHYVPACAPSPAAAASRLELSALGDFEPSNASVAILQSDSSQQALELPEGTLAAELNTLDGEPYWGSGALDAHNRIPILLWPEQRACALAQIETDTADAETWLAGGSDRLAALLVLGASANGSDAYRVDLTSGSAARLEPGSAPRTPRQRGTIAELGEQLLLAGGVDAVSGRVLDDGELFDPLQGRFATAPLQLARPRARHAAVPLPGGGSLLIGGESETGEALRSVEVVTDEPGRTARAYDLLSEARIAPCAVLLGQERVLVGGGYTLDAAGGRLPVARAELLRTDLSLTAELPIELAPALDRAFAALGPGSALAVGGCEPSATPTSECVACEAGCVSRAVFWLDSRGSAYELEALPATLAVPTPQLVAGANGSPWLIAGARLARFDPWRGRFEPVDAGPAGSAAALSAFALRPGLFAWLTPTADGVSLLGLYHSQRGPWARDVAPLLLGSAAGLVPDRPPGASTDEVRLEYAAATGLTLAGPEAIVSVADTEYADFTLELTLAEGPPPLVRLIGSGNEAAAFGGIDCPWPTDPGGSTTGRLRLGRALDQVRLERLDAAGTSRSADVCLRPLPARLSLQLLGTRDGVSRITRVEVARSSD